MKLQDKGQSQTPKGTFTSKLSETVLWEIIRMMNDAWLYEDIVKDVAHRYKVREATAGSWFGVAQRVEVRMRTGCVENDKQPMTLLEAVESLGISLLIQ